MNNTDEITLQVREAARRVGVSPQLLYKEIKEGRLQARRRPRLTLVALTDLMAWYGEFAPTAGE